ncbi:MAG: hypothetical protein HY789_12030 [Deltaproteobacteria bacterium]|nr:hypothetical protein [Deltaproteobacteria bacterium]
MAYLYEHCCDCLRILGREWSEIHIWLDALSGQYHDDHRRHRHHSEGVEEVRRTWGDEAARAAQIHIVVDCWGIPYAADYESGKVNKFGFTEESVAEDVPRLLQEIVQEQK